MAETLCLLLLEEHPKVFESIEKCLRYSELTATLWRAESLNEGLSLLAGIAFDALLIEDSFGFESVRKIIERKPSLPVILLSDAESGSPLANDFASLGVQDLLPKNCSDFQAFSRTVQYAINCKLADLNLDVAQSQIENLGSRASDAFLTFNQHGDILSVNASAELLLCAVNATLIGSAVSNIFDAATARQFQTMFEGVLATEMIEFSAFSEGHIQNVKGELIKVEFSVGHWRLDSSEIYSLIVRDISLHKAIEKQVQNALQVQKALGHIQALRQQQGLLKDKLYEALRALRTISWLRSSEQTGIGLYLEQDGKPPDYIDIAMDISQRDLEIAKRQPGFVSNGLEFYFDQQNNRHWFVVQAAGGKPLAYLVVSGRPPLLANTESSKQFRLLLCTMALMIDDHQASARIARMSQAIEQSPAGVVMTDSEGTIRYVNQAIVAMTGYDQQEIIGQNPRLLKSGLVADRVYEELWETIRSGEIWKGEIQNRRKDGVIYWESMLVAPVRNVSSHQFDYIAIKENIDQRKSDERQLLHMATHDPLTGLPNRSLLLDRLEQALARSRRDREGVSVLLLDLDQFSLINDQQGHLVGDELLRLVAKRLKKTRRETDTVGRQGGDEFVVVLPQVKSAEKIQPIVDSILNAVSKPCQIGGQSTQIACSIGIAVCMTGETSAEDLYRQADIAMYEAKKSGGNSSQIFSAEMDEYLNSKIWFRSAIKFALQNGELQLYYQPQINTKSGFMAGAEALLRWSHPEKGAISPADFIPMAEETGSINEIGDWVIKEVCHQLRVWLDMGYTPPRVAINLSAQQLADDELAAKLQYYMKLFEVAPELLEVELTESEIMQSPERSISVLTDIRKLGVHVSGDDFGTGYSSLSYLKRLPLDRLKIDRSFITDINRDQDSHIIAAMIIDLGHNLGLKVLAEGVELVEQLQLLTRLGCDEFQGFYCSPALPAEHFARLMQAGIRLVEVEEVVNASRTLLLVSHEPDSVESLQRLLGIQGYQVLTAAEPGLALQHLASHEIGVILCEQNLPSISGIEFLTRVKGLYPSAVRIILSGETGVNSIVAAINEGSIFKFLIKPWDGDVLTQCVEEAFQLYEVKSKQGLLLR